MWMSGPPFGDNHNQRNRLGNGSSGLGPMDTHPLSSAEPATAAASASTLVSATSAQPRNLPGPASVDTRSSRPGPVTVSLTHPGHPGPGPMVLTPNSATSSTVYAASPSPADASYPSHYHHGHRGHSHSHSHSRSLSNTSNVTAAAGPAPGPGQGGAASSSTPNPYGTRSTRAGASAAGYSNSTNVAGVKREPTDDPQGVSNGDYSSNSNGHHVAGLGGTTPRWSVSGPSESVEGDNDSTASPTSTTTGGGGPQRKKQKRNKPTLSCFECVERKTKVSLVAKCMMMMFSSDVVVFHPILSLF